MGTQKSEEEVMSQAASTRDAGHPVDPNFDPLDPRYLADPYPYYAKFREGAPVFYAPKVDFWVVSRYEDIQNVVKDPETFSNKRVQEPLHPITPEALAKLKEGVRVVPTTSTADPPLHKRTRKHAARAFSAKRVAGLEGRIREVANRLIDRVAADGRADLVDAFPRCVVSRSYHGRGLTPARVRTKRSSKHAYGGDLWTT